MPDNSSMREPLLSEKKKTAETEHRPPMITSRDLDVEESEKDNVASLERNHGAAQELSQRDAQFQQVHDLLQQPSSTMTESPPSSPKERKSAMRFKKAARQVALLQRLQTSKKNVAAAAAADGSSLSNTRRVRVGSGGSGGGGGGHRRNASAAAADLLDEIHADQQDRRMVQEHEQNQAVLQAAGIDVVPLFDEKEEDENEEQGNEVSVEYDGEERKDHEGDPLLPVVDSSSQYGSIEAGQHSTGTSFLLRKSVPTWRRCCGLVTRFGHFCLHTTLLFTLAMPLVLMALFLYYVLGNPKFAFLPGTARMAWLLNFLGRQVVTLELARLTQWVVLDWFLLGTRFSTIWKVPFVTMTALQSKGWPFLLASWACWDLLILHGKDNFDLHWLYWTGWRMYSRASESGQFILTSELYTRVLLAMIVTGVLTTAKRMALTVRFGRRTLGGFKIRLEKLLSDIVLLSEVADLSVEAAKMAEEGSNTTDSLFSNRPKAPQQRGAFKWSSVKFEHVESDVSEGEEEGSPVETPADSAKDDADHHPQFLRRNSSGSVMIKSLLENWEEPDDRQNKSNEASIQDVLKFKHALHFLNNTNPFGESFGPAEDRDECIASSHHIYYQLLKCTPDEPVLSFEVLSLVACDENGVFEDSKLKALRRLFRPDAKNRLPLLAFVQSCDTVYKRLRYFKASVSNASVIDNALEHIVNTIFGFVMALVLLLLLNFNPWPLLVSMTSLIVSVSFALGPSASKQVEGMLFILKRPFDLGDRILIGSAESFDTPGASVGWFVEDISLTQTKLRWCKTNEVASINNFAISQSKIVNMQRSPSANVYLQLKLHQRILEDNNLDDFRAALEKFVHNHPRIWDSLIVFRHDLFGAVAPTTTALTDADYRFVIFTVAFQHRLGWQSAARINLHRADLLRYIYDVCSKLNVQFDSPEPRRLIVQRDPDADESYLLDPTRNDAFTDPAQRASVALDPRQRDPGSAVHQSTRSGLDANSSQTTSVYPTGANVTDESHQTSDPVAVSLQQQHDSTVGARQALGMDLLNSIESLLAGTATSPGVD